MIENINETKSWFFGMINKINKSLATPRKKKQEDSKKVKYENVVIATETTGTLCIMNNYTPANWIT